MMSFIFIIRSDSILAEYFLNLTKLNTPENSLIIFLYRLFIQNWQENILEEEKKSSAIYPN